MRDKKVVPFRQQNEQARHMAVVAIVGGCKVPFEFKVYGSKFRVNKNGKGKFQLKRLGMVRRTYSLEIPNHAI